MAMINRVELETVGPNRRFPQTDYHTIDRQVAELVLEYQGWFGYRDGAFAKLLDTDSTRYFQEMDLTDVGRRLIFLTEFPDELARNIIKFEAIRRNLSARQVYHQLRRESSWYWHGDAEYPQDRDDRRRSAQIMSCLLHPRYHYAKQARC